MKIVTKAILSAVIAMMIGLLPMIALWINFPVTLSMNKAQATVSDIQVKSKSELVGNEFTISATCYFHELFFVFTESPLIKIKPFILSTCDQSASNLFLEKYKHQSVTGYFSITDNIFIPTELLDRRTLVTSIALSLVFIVIGFLVNPAANLITSQLLRPDKGLNLQQLFMILAITVLISYFFL